MRIGWSNAIGVGPLLVVRTTDTTWQVLTPDGDMALVSEDAHEFGYLGERWAIDAVLLAEQEYDRSEAPTVEVSESELAAAFRDLAAACLMEEAFPGEGELIS